MIPHSKLAEIIRGERVESEHYGSIVWINQSGLHKSIGDPNTQAFTRSIIKPIQSKIALEQIPTNLDPESIAISCASHNNEESQIAVLHKLMNQFKIQESDLFCGSIQHNCAGKHCLLAIASKDYYKEDSQIHKLIYQELQRLNPQLGSIPIASDGCGLNTYYMSLLNMGICFVNLIQDPSYSPIIQAMNQYPYLIGGHGQFDSELMSQYPNQFIAKGGAEGLMMIANLKNQEVIIIKIADGSKRAKTAIAVELLKSINWIKELDYDSQIYNAQATIAGRISVLAGF